MPGPTYIPTVSKIRTLPNNYYLETQTKGTIAITINGFPNVTELTANLPIIKVLGSDMSTVLTTFTSASVIASDMNTILINNFNMQNQIQPFQDLNVNAIIYFSLQFTFNELPLLFRLYIKKSIIINNVSGKVMYPTSKFTLENGNKYQIFGKRFTTDCGVRIYKNNNNFFDYFPNSDNNNNVSVDNGELISMDFDVSSIFPDGYSRQFQIQVVRRKINPDSIDIISVSQKIILDIVPLLNHTEVAPYYNLPQNTLIVSGIGFQAYDFNTGAVFPDSNLSRPSCIVLDGIFPNIDYTSNFTYVSHSNTSCTFNFTKLVPPQDSDNSKIQIGQIKTKFYLRLQCLDDILTGTSAPASFKCFSSLVVFELFKALSKYTTGKLDSIDDVNYSVNAYSYSCSALAGVLKYFEQNRHLNENYSGIRKTSFSASALVPIIYALINSTTTYSIQINGNTIITNNLLLYTLTKFSDVDSKGRSIYNVDLAVKELAPDLAQVLQTLYSQSNIVIGYITMNDLSKYILYYIYQGYIPYFNTTIEIKTPALATICQAEYFASEKQTLFDYLFEFESPEFAIPLSLMKNTFKYKNSDNGILFSIDQSQLNMFKFKLDNLFKNAIFRLVNNFGSYVGSKILAPAGNISRQFIYQLRSFLLGSPMIGGPIRNETEIMQAINEGLQYNGDFISFGTQISKYLFTIDINGNVSNDVLIMFNALSANCPERFNKNANGDDLINFVSFPFLGGDVISFISLIGGPIVPTHGNVYNSSEDTRLRRNEITMKDIFPEKCSPNPASSPMDYLLDSTGKIIRTTKNMFKILIVDDTLDDSSPPPPSPSPDVVSGVNAASIAAASAASTAAGFSVGSANDTSVKTAATTAANLSFNNYQGNLINSLEAILAAVKAAVNRVIEMTGIPPKLASGFQINSDALESLKTSSLAAAAGSPLKIASQGITTAALAASTILNKAIAIETAVINGVTAACGGLNLSQAQQLLVKNAALNQLLRYPFGNPSALIEAAKEAASTASSLASPPHLLGSPTQLEVLAKTLKATSESPTLATNNVISSSALASFLQLALEARSTALTVGAVVSAASSASTAAGFAIGSASALSVENAAKTAALSTLKSGGITGTADELLDATTAGVQAANSVAGLLPNSSAANSSFVAALNFIQGSLLSSASQVTAAAAAAAAAGNAAP
jgi:hypothetical protein